MADKQRVTQDITTGIGTLSFPHVFSQTAGTNDKGEPVFDIQFIIPKSQREDVRAILRAIKTVGEAKWGANWKKVRTPLRDGDAEAEELTEDGSTKGAKYPERLGCYFLNARSSKPVGVYDRMLTPITDPENLYGGCKGKISVTFYPYSTNGNHGIGVGLNGVQKIAEGTPFGNARPTVESMFDVLDENDLEELGLTDDDGLDPTDLDEMHLDADLDVDDDLDEEPTPPPAKRAAAKKAPAKRAAAKKAAPAPVEDDEDDEADLYDDL
jgi:hypothetical protein